MATKTTYLVQTFDLKRKRLVPGQRDVAPAESGARKRAEAMARRRSRLSPGDFDEQASVTINVFSQLAPDLLDPERAFGRSRAPAISRRYGLIRPDFFRKSDATSLTRRRPISASAFRRVIVALSRRLERFSKIFTMSG